VLESLGLDVRTEEVYRALLHNPAWDVTDIAGHLGITTQVVHDELDVLVDLSLLKPSPQPQSQIHPVSPELGLGALLAQQEIELASRQQQVEQNRTVIAGLIEEYRVAHTKGGSFEHLEGLQAVRDRLEELAHKAQHECESLLPGGPVTDDTMDASRPLDELALSRGVTVRTVFQDSFRNDPATTRYVRWLHERGGETRSKTVGQGRYRPETLASSPR
jgi:sugar-specific transcriptional regulator TrmB